VKYVGGYLKKRLEEVAGMFEELCGEVRGRG
jgi:4-aminobutyrate aminotransferase-like enzyme